VQEKLYLTIIPNLRPIVAAQGCLQPVAVTFGESGLCPVEPDGTETAESGVGQAMFLFLIINNCPTVGLPSKKKNA